MVNEQMDLERRQFPMCHGQSASFRVSKPTFGPFRRRYRRAFFVSPNPKEQSQGINSPLYAWAAETLQSFLPQLAKMGILGKRW
jgi:hypothetical protein